MNKKLFTSAIIIHVMFFVGACSNEQTVNTDSPLIQRKSLIETVIDSHPSSYTTMQVCKKLAEAKIAVLCKEELPEGIGAAAVEKTAFVFSTSSDVGGQVLLFRTHEALMDNVKTFESLAFLAGPHRYFNEKYFIFIQMNESATLETGKSVKQILFEL